MPRAAPQLAMRFVLVLVLIAPPGSMVALRAAHGWTLNQHPTCSGAKAACERAPRPEPIILAAGEEAAARGVLRTQWHGAALAVSERGEVDFGARRFSLAELRCGLGRVREVGWRFVTGGRNELAVLVLEEDDRNTASAVLDAQSAAVTSSRRRGRRC